MCSPISIRGYVRPSDNPSVSWLVRRLISQSHMSWISEKWAQFEQNSIRNKIDCDSKTSTGTVCENPFPSSHGSNFWLSSFHIKTWHSKSCLLELWYYYFYNRRLFLDVFHYVVLCLLIRVDNCLIRFKKLLAWPLQVVTIATKIHRAIDHIIMS